jgi:hypothetical protein
VTETDPQTPQAESPRRMQFGISTMLLAVLVAATGCMGWKLADWMVNTRGETAALAWSLMALSTLLFVFIAGIGRRRIILPTLIGLLANGTILISIAGMPRKSPMVVFVLLLPCIPGASLCASLWLAFLRAHPIDVRMILLLGSTFFECWILAAFILH